jgi:hypothetical protein
MKTTKIKTTTPPVQTGNLTGTLPEFGRATDLHKMFGLRRGTIYNLLAAGKIRGCLLRIKGKKSGVRVFDIQSVRDFIRSQMEAA